MKYATLYISRDAWHGLPVRKDADVLQGARAGDDGFALIGLETWLAELARGQKVRLVLSAACVPMASTPWSVSIASTGALRREIEASWTQRLGADHGHAIRIHWPRHGMPLLSLAWPPLMCERIKEQLAGHRVVEVACSVFAIAAADTAVGEVERSLLLFGEEDGYCALHMLSGEPVGVEQFPLNGHGLDAMPVWMRRKQLEYPDDGAIRWLVAADAPKRSMLEVLA